MSGFLEKYAEGGQGNGRSTGRCDSRQTRDPEAYAPRTMLGDASLAVKGLVVAGVQLIGSEACWSPFPSLVLGLMGPE